MHACMYEYMSLGEVVVGKRCACKLCIPLCASHDNVMRACTNAILSGTVQCMVDGWMIVMNGNGDTWFVRSCERVMERRCRIE